MKPNIPRLKKLVELMMYDEDPWNFSMLTYRAVRGTPACLFGHARLEWPELVAQPYDGLFSLEFFGIDEYEAKFLFSSTATTTDDWSRSGDTPSIAAARVIDLIEYHT